MFFCVVLSGAIFHQQVESRAGVAEICLWREANYLLPLSKRRFVLIGVRRRLTTNILKHLPFLQSVRVPGIEPGSFDWQPNVLPLNHTRNWPIISYVSQNVQRVTFSQPSRRPSEAKSPGAPHLEKQYTEDRLPQ